MEKSEHLEYIETHYSEIFRDYNLEQYDNPKEATKKMLEFKSKVDVLIEEYTFTLDKKTDK